MADHAHAGIKAAVPIAPNSCCEIPIHPTTGSVRGPAVRAERAKRVHWSDLLARRSGPVYDKAVYHSRSLGDKAGATSGLLMGMVRRFTPEQRGR